MSLSDLINGGALAVLLVFNFAVLRYLVRELEDCQRWRNRVEERVLRGRR
ncbi:MAG TPA: hypothetical protein VH475_13120 [Tepidisphaeraceae bacterium]|jgi:hypothetical protein